MPDEIARKTSSRQKKAWMGSTFPHSAERIGSRQGISNYKKCEVAFNLQANNVGDAPTALCSAMEAPRR